MPFHPPQLQALRQIASLSYSVVAGINPTKSHRPSKEYRKNSLIEIEGPKMGSFR